MQLRECQIFYKRNSIALLRGPDLAEHEWKIGKPAAVCCRCSANFTQGQSYFSALEHVENSEVGVGLQRKDYCADCFQAEHPANVFYFWKTAQPLDDEELLRRRQPVVDLEYVFEFFKRLEGDGNPQRVAFRYILALMLARRKLLIFEERKKDAAGMDVHIYREKRGEQRHSVIEPDLREEEIAGVSAELGVLLGLSPAVPPVEAETTRGAS